MVHNCHNSLYPILHYNILSFCNHNKQSLFTVPSIHLKIAPRGSLEVESFALVEHCRAIGIARIIFPQIANLSEIELTDIISRLNNLLVS
jgi:mRNA interferase MazF